MDCSQSVIDDAFDRNDVCPVLQKGAISGIVGAMSPRDVGDFIPEVFYLFELLDHGGDHVIELVRLGGWQVEGVLSGHEFADALG